MSKWNDFWKSIGDSIKKGWSWEPAKWSDGSNMDLFGFAPGSKADTYARDILDTYTGHTTNEATRKSTELAERQEEWNESFSEKQLKQADEQFQKTNELAQANLGFQTEYAEKNFKLAQQTYLDQKAENALMREREDTAMQRQVADLKAAGLSPLMASGGASSAGATVGAAPQYDMSGVSTAQGSLINLAQEYAQLRQMAQGEYANRKNTAINNQIAAKQVLADLSMQRRQQGMSFAQQAANFGLNVKELKLRADETSERIEASKAQRKWYSEHGYRNDKIWTVLTPILTSLADNLKIDYESLKEVFSNFSTEFNISLQDIKSIYDGTEEGFAKLKSKTQVLNGAEISKDSYDNMISVLSGESEDFNTKDFSKWYMEMNEEFRDKFTYKQFRKALTGESKLLRSSILSYILFGNSGNI